MPDPPGIGADEHTGKIRYFSWPLLDTADPMRLCRGDGIIDVLVEADAVPAGRYLITEMREHYVVARHV